MSTRADRWHCVHHNGDTSLFVFSVESDYGGRRADRRRWSILEQSGGRAVLEISVQDGWDVAHRSHHRNLAAAKRAAKEVTFEHARGGVDGVELDSTGYGWWSAPWTSETPQATHTRSAQLRRSIALALRIALDEDPNASAAPESGPLAGRVMPRAFWRGYLEAHLEYGGQIYVCADEIAKLKKLHARGWPL